MTPGGGRFARSLTQGFQNRVIPFMREARDLCFNVKSPHFNSWQYDVIFFQQCYVSPTKHVCKVTVAPGLPAGKLWCEREWLTGAVSAAGLVETTPPSEAACHRQPPCARAKKGLVSRSGLPSLVTGVGLLACSS